MKTRRPWIRTPSLTIRTLVILWAVNLFLAWAVLVVGWYAVERKLSDLGNQLFQNIITLNTVRELELAVLGYTREELLWHATYASEHQQHGVGAHEEHGGRGQQEHLASKHQQRRDEYLRTAEQIIADFDSYVTTVETRELWTQVRDGLRFFHEHSASCAHAPLETEEQHAEDLRARVDRLRAQYTREMGESLHAAEWLHKAVGAWAISLSGIAAVMLVVGSLSVINRMICPVLALTGTATAFGQGDFSAKAPVLHEDEMGALARTFNNMAADIADRENHRLQFVAMVVHDLKNPLLAIEMAGRMLRASIENEQKRHTFLDAIGTEVKRLRGIVRDLTDDIQVASGHFRVRKTQVELNALVRQLVQTQAETFASHEIALETSGECLVLGDPERIERVVQNLVSNAVKYSPRGTRVTVRIEKRERLAVLSISDEGPGIREEDLRVLFQPFGRGWSAGTFAEGTGMGLYIVKRIIEAHSGRIEVESELGRGSTFRVSLPLVGSQSQGV